MSLDELLRRLVREEVRAALAERHDAPAAPSSLAWLPIKSCGLRPTTVRRLVKAGALEASRVGRELLVSRSSVERYIEGQRVGPREGDELDRTLRVVRGSR